MLTDKYETIDGYVDIRIQVVNSSWRTMTGMVYKEQNLMSLRLKLNVYEAKIRPVPQARSRNGPRVVAGSRTMQISIKADAIP